MSGSPPGPANVAQAGIPPLDAAADTSPASPPPAGHARGAIPNAGPSDTPILDSVSSQLKAKIYPTSRPSKIHGHLGARRKPTAHRTSYSWEVSERSAYHEYVHNLVLTGWDNLKRLDDYMENDIQDTNLAVSVIDIKSNHEVERVQDLHSIAEVDSFLQEQVRGNARVRMYLVEHGGSIQSSMIDCLGQHLQMDPRFFASNLFGPYMVIAPADRHRAPFSGLGFTVLRPTRSRTTETKFFRVSIYVKPDINGAGWCGVILFNSHAKLQLSLRTLCAPPPFGHPIPGLSSQSVPTISKVSQYNQPRSLRELYIDALKLSDLTEAASSPFYAFCPLLKLNFHCWNEVINTIRTEDRRLSDISEASLGHVEEIQHTLAMIERYGTSGWQDLSSTSKEPPSQKVQNTQAELIEDFKHLLNQTDLLWEERRNMASIRDRQRQSRWSTLTNSFTFIFVPISLISSIYGMNVSEISGTEENPNIWQFFVACIGLNVVILLLMVASHWVGEMRKYRRLVGVKEVWAFATNMDGR
ncbi:hypothetical protein EYR41_008814 [Orbilia oligospora]|uniref:Uncharacterized protein n=1 Tax=Orbilia oligospora TaxID=2813651 RepID=A0A7C8K4J5_ORBOL|nr:hypothetical protein TWF751_010310 [Orbilia oligospora]TGJ67246.1 hypothetical protein EYR41_008814 [Orbilia oligospora]